MHVFAAEVARGLPLCLNHAHDCRTEFADMHACTQATPSSFLLNSAASSIVSIANVLVLAPLVGPRPKVKSGQRYDK